MCGRFTQLHTWEELHAWFSLSGFARNLPARYNVAPGQQVMILRAGDDGLGADALHWGLVPGWTRDPDRTTRLINARVETAAEKPSFRAAWRHRRCVVPASGFYEWARTGRARQPWYFSAADDMPLALAGLWDRWASPSGEVLESFAILTMPANDCVGQVHHRMPVILERDRVRAWLDDRALPRDGYAAGRMRCRAVGTRVNSARHDDPDCLEPAGEPGLLALAGTP